MFCFEKLSILNKHLKYLQKKLWEESIFAVGWCIRDIILWISQEPDDVDISMSGDPKKIYQNIDKKDISHFITEKFGTITIIPKNEQNKIQYEITPFRKESWYDDKRHPTEIERTNDLLMDVQRREFTIWAIYYFFSGKNNSWLQNSVKLPPEEILAQLKKIWYIYLEEVNLRIIQNHKIIENIFQKWKFQIKNLEKLKKEILDKKNIKFGEDIQILIDPVLWLQDMILWKLTTVWNPDNRFQEDALRIMRALRFINVINTKLQKTNTQKHYFDIEKNTRNSIKKNFFQIQYVAKERLKIELDKVFTQWNPFGFVALLDETNMLKFIFPSVYATKNIDQPIRYHPFDIYHHTLLVLFFTQKQTSNPLVRIASLYHDVGKVDQYYLYSLWIDRDEVAKIPELNHRNSSSILATKDLRALGFSNKEIDETAWYIDNHHRPEEILWAKIENQEKKLRKLLSDAWIEKILNLFDLVMWDRMGHFNPVQPPETDEINMLIEKAKKLHQAEWQFTPKNLAISWNDIMSHFKLNPGKKVWELLSKSFDWVIEEITTRNNKKSILSYLENFL